MGKRGGSADNPRLYKTGDLYRDLLSIMTSPTSDRHSRRAEILSSEARSLQYCLDMKHLRPHQYCEDCRVYMELKSCPTSKYKDGYCWICSTAAAHTRSVRADSILHRRKIPFSTFLHLTWLYCDGIDVYNCARTLSLNHKTVQSLYTALQGSTSTSPGIPSLTCQDCRRTIRSGYADEPEGFDIVVRIAPCSKHSTRPVTSRPTSTAGAPPRQSFVQIVSSALTAAAQTTPSTPAPAAPAPAAPAPAASAPAASAPAAPAPAASAPAAPAPAASAPAAPAPATPAPATPAPAASAPAAPAPAASAPAPAPVAPAAESPSRPLRRSRTFILPGVIAEYDRILARVKTGSNLTNAVKAEGLSLSFFSRKRCVAEAAKVDLPALQEGLLQQSTPTLKGTFPVAVSICNQNLAVLRSMSLAGECILPKDRY